MTALQVRDFPPALYDELKEYAARNHRSIAQQTVIAVEKMLSASEMPVIPGGPLREERFDRLGGEAVDSSRHAQLWPQARTVNEERVRRRQQIFANFDTINWGESPTNADDIVAFINEGREERLNRILASVDSPECDD